jgi:hypothetical protein
LRMSKVTSDMCSPTSAMDNGVTRKSLAFC